MFPVVAVHVLVPHIAVDEEPNGKYMDYRVFILANVIWNIGIPLLFIIIRK